MRHLSGDVLEAVRDAILSGRVHNGGSSTGEADAGVRVQAGLGYIKKQDPVPYKNNKKLKSLSCFSETEREHSVPF